MNTYVIIPHYNNWQLTHNRLHELYKHCKDSVSEVIVVDDFSTDELTGGGLRWWAEFGVRYNFKVRALQMEENVGFLLASNFGIFDTVSKCNPDDIIILLSNDVEIRTDFVRQVTEKLGHGERALIGGILYSHDTGWNKFGDKVYPYLEGWLLATRSMDWQTLGGFDIRFAPSDFEDVDLSTLALKYEYELVALNNPGLHHIGGQSYGYTEERRKRTETNRKKFEEKWIEKNENSRS